MNLKELLKSKFPIFPCLPDKSPAVKDWKGYGDTLVAKESDFNARMIGMCMGFEWDFECIDVDSKNSGQPEIDCDDYV